MRPPAPSSTRRGRRASETRRCTGGTAPCRPGRTRAGPRRGVGRARSRLHRRRARTPASRRSSRGTCRRRGDWGRAGARRPGAAGAAPTPPSRSPVGWGRVPRRYERASSRDVIAGDGVPADFLRPDGASGPLAAVALVAVGRALALQLVLPVLGLLRREADDSVGAVVERRTHRAAARWWRSTERASTPRMSRRWPLCPLGRRHLDPPAAAGAGVAAVTPAYAADRGAAGHRLPFFAFGVTTLRPKYERTLFRRWSAPSSR